jgi:hypothetical protein
LRSSRNTVDVRKTSFERDWTDFPLAKHFGCELDVVELAAELATLATGTDATRFTAARSLYLVVSALRRVM